jgi:hypothetical protein
MIIKVDVDRTVIDAEEGADHHRITVLVIILWRDLCKL